LFAGVVLLTGADWVFAHHSFSATYDSAQKVEIEGVVKEFVWRNPHSFMRIDITDKDGTTKTWALEWGSASQLAQSQIARTTLRPGDRLIVGGEPAREASGPDVEAEGFSAASEKFPGPSAVVEGKRARRARFGVAVPLHKR
jgi:hypothetical protein